MMANNSDSFPPVFNLFPSPLQQPHHMAVPIGVIMGLHQKRCRFAPLLLPINSTARRFPTFSISGISLQFTGRAATPPRPVSWMASLRS